MIGIVWSDCGCQLVGSLPQKLSYLSRNSCPRKKAQAIEFVFGIAQYHIGPSLPTLHHLLELQQHAVYEFRCGSRNGGGGTTLAQRRGDIPRCLATKGVRNVKKREERCCHVSEHEAA